jgi:hypothetical protein
MPIVNKLGKNIEVAVEDAPIVNAIHEFLSINDWEDEILFDEESGESKLAFSAGIGDQRYQFFVEGSEDQDFIAVFSYTPFSVPPSRMGELCRLLNLINLSVEIGRLACADGGEPSSIQYKLKYDVTDGVCSGRMVDIAVDTAIAVFRTFQQALAEVVLGGRTAPDVWADYIKNVEAD